MNKHTSLYVFFSFILPCFLCPIPSVSPLPPAHFFLVISFYESTREELRGGGSQCAATLVLFCGEL
jgi:hypothetical protein